MDDSTREKVKLGLVIGCFTLAMVIFGANFIGKGGGGGGSKKGDLDMLCIDESCNAEYIISLKEFQEKMSKIPPQVMMGGGMIAFACPECNQETGYRAIKCEECEYVFLSGDAGDDRYPDRCPECDYSRRDRN